MLTIMHPADYQNWLATGPRARALAGAGAAAVPSYGCSGCHQGRSTVRAPSLAGLYGRPVPLEAGGTVVADDGYIRDKILMPDDNKIAGYKQVMPASRA